MVGGARLFITRAEECTTASHACLEGVAKEMPGGKDGVWVVMAKPSPHLPAPDYFQTKMGAYRAAKPMQQYSLHMWASIFQVIEA